MNDVVIPKIWDNKYFNKLGAIDHCHEVINLHSHIARLKSDGCDISRQEETLENEMVDLYLILSRRVDQARVESRIKRFNENSRKDEI